MEKNINNENQAIIEKMKIGIITFHAAFNYGSMLQAYAMQTFLERQGHHVEIVNFTSVRDNELYLKAL